MELASLIPAILSGISAILVAWFGYNQYTKDKLTDLKIEKYHNDEKEKAKRRIDHSSVIFGELWTLLMSLGADRVYIIQPHPLGNEQLLSVYYEALRKGLQSMRPNIHNIKISEVPDFMKALTQNQFLYLSDLKDVKDNYMRALLSTYGCEGAIIQRLSDKHYDCVGNIVCEFRHVLNMADEEKARAALEKAAFNIQYILPEYIE